MSLRRSLLRFAGRSNRLPTSRLKHVQCIRSYSTPSPAVAAELEPSGSERIGQRWLETDYIQ
jgi:hypothetical protein